MVRTPVILNIRRIQLGKGKAGPKEEAKSDGLDVYSSFACISKPFFTVSNKEMKARSGRYYFLTIHLEHKYVIRTPTLH